MQADDISTISISSAITFGADVEVRTKIIGLRSGSNIELAALSNIEATDDVTIVSSGSVDAPSLIMEEESSIAGKSVLINATGRMLLNRYARVTADEELTTKADSCNAHPSVILKGKPKTGVCFE